MVTLAVLVWLDFGDLKGLFQPKAFYTFVFPLLLVCLPPMKPFLQKKPQNHHYNLIFLLNGKGASYSGRDRIKQFCASQIFIFLLPCLHSLLSSLLSVFVSYLQKWMFPLKSHWFGICCQQCPEPDASGGGKPLPGPILVCNTALS